jgi:phage terminase large subunit GpA-like protein
MIPGGRGKRAARHVLVDVNHWKSFLVGRLATAIGDPGSLTLFGDRNTDHRLLAEHLTAEYSIRTEGRGRVLDEWKIRPERPDNHWLDCLVGAACAASLQGSALAGAAGPSARKKQTIKLSELRAKKTARYSDRRRAT